MQVFIYLRLTILKLFFNFRKSFTKCFECKISVTKTHLKCHFKGATGDKCDNTCQNQSEGDNSAESGFSHECISNVQPTFAQECSECAMVGLLKYFRNFSIRDNKLNQVV